MVQWKEQWIRNLGRNSNGKYSLAFLKILFFFTKPSVPKALSCADSVTQNVTQCLWTLVSLSVK